MSGCRRMRPSTSGWICWLTLEFPARIGASTTELATSCCRSRPKIRFWHDYRSTVVSTGRLSNRADLVGSMTGATESSKRVVPMLPGTADGGKGTGGHPVQRLLTNTDSHRQSRLPTPGRRLVRTISVDSNDRIRAWMPNGRDSWPLVCKVDLCIVAPVLRRKLIVPDDYLQPFPINIRLLNQASV
jgi:hypothetical protein